VSTHVGQPVDEPHDVIPAPHTVTHAPPAQTVPAQHFLPHAPQFDGSVAVFTHVQGSPHTTIPGAHPAAHEPEQQPPHVHALPQLPQFFGSVRTSTQVPEHTVAPASQDGRVSIATSVSVGGDVSISLSRAPSRTAVSPPTSDLVASTVASIAGPTEVASIAGASCPSSDATLPPQEASSRGRSIVTTKRTHPA
jgi:hypothetical protein